MEYILPLVGIAGSIVLMWWRETVGDMLGETKWIHDHGGIYTWVVLVAVFILLWSIAELVGVTDVVFTPIKSIFPEDAIYTMPVE